MPSSRNACRRNNIRGTAELPIGDFHYSCAGEGRLLLAGATRYSGLHPLRNGIVLARRLNNEHNADPDFRGGISSEMSG